MQGRWMIGLLLVLPGLLTETAHAQVDRTMVTTCQEFARQMYQDVEEVRQVQLLNDTKTRLYRYEDQVGNQFVSSELLGTGRLMTKKGWKPFSYLCLLESDRKAVYFRILTNIAF